MRAKRYRFWLLICAATLLASCGTGQQATQPAPTAGSQALVVDVSASEFAFTPSEIKLQVGQPLTVNFKNAGTVIHDWVVVEAQASNIEAPTQAVHGGHDEAPAVHIAAQPGQSGTLRFTPTKAGSYQIICSEPGHKEAGMVGTLLVE